LLAQIQKNGVVYVFACAITLNLTLTRFYRKLLLLVVAIVVTAPKHRNGVVAQLAHELYAMPAV
jgi:hypothetical protein